MEFFRIRKDIPFMRHSLVFNAISLITFIAAVFFLFSRGLHLSVEFTGGTVMEVSYSQPADLAKVRDLKPVADELGCTQAQLALAWCLKNPNVSTVITGASRAEQVHENMKALDVAPKLTDDLMQRIDEILGNKPQ